ncbi:MAG: sulfurtransferase [Actinobacteria bacterium 13_2_20CM_68_14]|jgi:thiosulfate/3-mercaptopyruvate sulfurtransferase|nr:MAG: sulfurtransferase [Actinobacteria bacterium 13_2_20CM_68_14]
MAENGYAKPVLVTTDWLAEHLNDDSVVVAEVDENPDLYDEGHIAGAVKLHWRDDLQDPVERDLVDKPTFERLLSERGIANDTTLVLYGDKNNWFAAYAYWYLKIYGHGDVRILDGGRQKWADEAREFTAETPQPQQADYRANERDESIRTYRDSVRAQIGEQSKALVDVRSPQEYAGDLIAPPGYEQEGAQRAGHIPTAASIPWATAVRDDGTFKSADELRELYEGKGVTPEKEVTAYCRIGERSAHTWFVLRELLGYETVKNYDGSWTEWGNLVDVPIEKGS